MLFSIGATEDTAWRGSAAAGSDRIIAGRGTYTRDRWETGRSILFSSC
jgi:hypothetical protein